MIFFVNNLTMVSIVVVTVSLITLLLILSFRKNKWVHSISKTELEHKKNSKPRLHPPNISSLLPSDTLSMDFASQPHHKEVNQALSQSASPFPPVSNASSSNFTEKENMPTNTQNDHYEENDSGFPSSAGVKSVSDEKANSTSSDMEDITKKLMEGTTFSEATQHISQSPGSHTEKQLLNDEPSNVSKSPKPKDQAENVGKVSNTNKKSLSNTLFTKSVTEFTRNLASTKQESKLPISGDILISSLMQYAKSVKTSEIPGHRPSLENIEKEPLETQSKPSARGLGKLLNAVRSSFIGKPQPSEFEHAQDKLTAEEMFHTNNATLVTKKETLPSSEEPTEPIAEPIKESALEPSPSLYPEISSQPVSEVSQKSASNEVHKQQPLAALSPTSCASTPPPRSSYIPSGFFPSKTPINPPITVQETMFTQNHDDYALAKNIVPAAIPKLENEIIKKFHQFIKKAGYALPNLHEGFLANLQNMVSTDQAEVLFECLEKEQFRNAREKLNEIVEQQNQVFVEWRRTFGKFSRLFSVITLNEDVAITVKSMKKATELDPTEAWNWYVLGMLSLQTGAMDDYYNNFEKALSTSVSYTPTLSSIEAMERVPYENNVQVFILTLEELAALHEKNQEWSKAAALLTRLRKYFHDLLAEQSQQLNTFFVQHCIESLVQYAEVSLKLHDRDQAIALFEEALEKPFCSGERRLNVLLRLMEIHNQKNCDPKKVEGWFNECSSLILNFPQQQSNSAQYYRTLAEYNLTRQDYGKAEPLFELALNLDTAFAQINDQIFDLHGLAKIAKSRNILNKAEALWQKAVALVDTVPNQNGLDKVLLADVYLSLGESYENANRISDAKPLFEKGITCTMITPPQQERALRLRYLADRYYERDELNESVVLYTKALALFEQCNAYAQVRDLALACAKVYVQLKRLDDSEKALDHVVLMLQKMPNPVIAAQCQLLYGQVAWEKNDNYRAIEKGMITLNLTKNTEQPRQIIRETHELLGLCYLRAGDFVSAAIHWPPAISLAKNTSHVRHLIRYQLSWVETLIELEKYEEAIELLAEAVSLASEQENRDAQISISILKARSWSRQNKHEHAESLLLENLDRAKLTTNDLHLAQISGALGEFYLYTDNIDKCRHYTQDAITIFQKLGFVYDEVCQKYRMGVLLAKTGPIEDAESILTGANRRFTEFGALRLSAEASIVLAKLKLKQNRMQEAEGDYQNAITTFEKINAPLRTAKEYANLGVLKMRCGHPKEAREDWLKAKHIFQQYDNKELLAQVNNWLEILGGDNV